MSKPVIRSIRCYQAVSFEKSNETTFIVKGTQRKKPVNVTMDTELPGVHIKSSKDHIFVPITNISCIHYECPLSIAKDEEDAKEIEVKKAISKSHKDVSKKPR